MREKTKSKNLTCYFYRIQTNDGINEDSKDLNPDDFITFIEYLKDIQLDDRLWGKEGDERTIVFKSDLEKGLTGLSLVNFEGYVTGAFMHKRDVALPYSSIENENKLELNPIEIDGNLMEVTYFLIHKESGTLLLLNNRFVGSISSFQQYLTNFLFQNGNLKQYRRINTNNSTRFFLAPILNLDPKERLNNLTIIKSFNAKFIRSNESGYDYIKSKDSLSYFEELGDALNGSNINIRITPKRNGSLNIPTLKDICKKILPNMKKIDNNYLRIEGIDSEKQFHLVDLLNDKMLYKTTVTYEGKNVPARIILETMHDEYEKRLSEIVV